MSDAARRRATWIGATAVAMWATLAACAALTRPLPSFQATALCFLLSGSLGAIWLASRGRLRAALAQPWRAWALGVYGLFGSHALYFLAVRLAPPVQANLLNYLWPLMLVLASALAPGAGLERRHVIGAVVGLAGAGVALAGGDAGDLALRPEALVGYVCAVGAGAVWASYTILTRRQAEVPTESMVGFALAAAVLSGLCHLAFEITVAPGPVQAAGLVFGGLFPLGLSFLAWDHGAKRGDLPVLGALAYATPVLSTLLLVVLGLAAPSWALLVGCLLVAGGAVIASRDLLRRA